METDPEVVDEPTDEIPEDEVPVAGWSPTNDTLVGIYYKVERIQYGIESIVAALDMLRFVVKLVAYAVVGWCLGYVIGTILL